MHSATGSISKTYSYKVCELQGSTGGVLDRSVGARYTDQGATIDDQILLQLGDSANLEADQKAEFINGLRQLLTEFRDQKVKDFKTISEGIIKYRARFNRDETKVLPLGNIAL